MAVSFLRYNLSRPYPFAWFTPAVALGFVLLATFFSFLNFAANGYELRVVYTNNPNTTFAHEKWLTAWPFSLMEKVKFSCEARDIAVGTRFFTNKLSLPYRLDSVTRLGADDGSTTIVPSLSYLNNTLEDCLVYNLQIELLAEDRTAAQFGYTQWGPKISASVSCGVISDAGSMRINISTEYDLIPPTIENGQQTTLLHRDAVRKASLWWGESLISAYWIELAWALQELRPTLTFGEGNFTANIRKGSINLAAAPSSNFTTLDFFTTRFHFIGNAFGDGEVPIHSDQDTDGHSLQSWIDNQIQPDIWNLTDRFGKAFYSTVLTDLGQVNIPHLLRPNDSSTESLLEEYTSIFVGHSRALNAVMGPATIDYTTYKQVRAENDQYNDIGPLSITPSTIYSQYLCQIPQKKPWAVLVVAVLVADLVFLRLVWTLTTLVATWWVERTDEKAMWCEGTGEEEYQRHRAAVGKDEEGGVDGGSGLDGSDAGTGIDGTTGQAVVAARVDGYTAVPVRDESTAAVQRGQGGVGEYPKTG